MGDSHLTAHVHTAVFVQIFNQVNDNGLEGVALLFEFGNDILEGFPRCGAFGHSAFDLHFVLDVDVRCINEFDVAVRVQHQRIGECVRKGGFSAERRTVNPNDTLFHLFDVSSFIFG